jgi:hypothetical protein
LAILTGTAAHGLPDSENVNEMVSKRLNELALGLKQFAAVGHDGSAESK